MATIVTDRNDYAGNLRLEILTVTMSSSYSTGGEAVAPSMGNIVLALSEPKSGYVFEYDYTNKKLKAFYADNNAAADSALIEVPATTNLSAVAPKVLFLGQ